MKEKLKKVLIASTNPVKIEATRQGFETMFPMEQFEFIGMSIDSDISDQPMGQEETLKGAINRVENLKRSDIIGDFYVGIEGGNIRLGNDMFVFAWIVIDSTTNQRAKAQTGHFMIPPKIIELIDQGYELGHADDIVFGMNNSKQSSGSVGILTDDIIDRKQYYVHAMILALIPFKKQLLFRNK